MPLQKQPINIPFDQGIETKTDPNQTPLGKFQALSNSIFTKGGLLGKRNGFAPLSSLSNTTSTTIAAYQDSLVAMGNTFQVYSAESESWLNRGVYQPVSLSVLPLVRGSTYQAACDLAIASNNLACVVYQDSSTSGYFYRLVDSTTGQIIVNQTALPSTANMVRTYFLGQYLIITFLATVGGTPHLQYIAIPINNPTNPSSATDISTQVKTVSTGYDAIVNGTNLYFAWNASDGGGAVRLNYLDSTLALHGVKVISGKVGDLVSITADSSGVAPVIWVSFWDGTTHNAYSASYDQNLNAVLSSTQILNAVTGLQTLTSSAASNTLHVFYQVSATYSYNSVRSDTVSTVTITTGAVTTSPAVVLRGVGLASKSFYFSDNAKHYFLVAYSGAFQPSYFLADQSGNVVAKLASGSGGGYVATQVLPNVNLSDSIASFSYLFKDQSQPVNTAQGATNVSPIYTQVGVNLVNFNFTSSGNISIEAESTLNMGGGFLWMYDGVKPVEQNFHLFPEDIGVTTSGAGGSIGAQLYYYYVCYAWTDSQGNVHRSAPSIPMAITTTGATSTNTIKVPTARLTYKITPNPIRIEIYRWSLAQQIPYLVNSITSPLLNDPSVDSVTYSDTAADSSIIGNLILYTTGGVVENIGPPASNLLTVFKSRLFLIDAENPNLIWFSKQLIDSAPVEMSDLFTIFVPPTTTSQGNSGPITAICSMDDKLIVFKKNSIFYITGNGPDNTGANNDFSDPIYITSTIGCTNQASIVFIPQGILFQSDKGIWLLGRDLSSNYIGAPAEQYNTDLVLSAVIVPESNQVRFSLDSGVLLMYDYFYGQWGTFSNVPAISGTIYQSLHTYLNESGQVLQETPALYLDNGSPVLMSFTTGWINVAGLQGYQRAYWLYLLGSYLSPHKLSIQIAYDYEPAISQNTIISPTNFNDNYGDDPLYGSSTPFGGSTAVEQWRIFLQRQKCQSFQLSLQEIYDPSFGLVPGAGFTLSGLNLTIGVKSGYPRLDAAHSAG